LERAWILFGASLTITEDSVERRALFFVVERLLHLELDASSFRSLSFPPPILGQICSQLFAASKDIQFCRGFAAENELKHNNIGNKI
jgi:hypothetical protein